MNPTKEQAFEKISELVERFREHVEEYKRGTYNEHQTRVDFINPFFKALGWDMDNEQGHAEAYREVIHEDKVKVGVATKAPDYAFTLFGQRKFFVDAKKPGINIRGDVGPAYQVRRYGWSAKVPLSVVTDFEEFAIYDCTKKPNPGDKSSVSRIKYLTFEQYLDEFDFLWDIFAKENLPKGRLDKYVQSDTGKKGTTTVDEEFLKSIEQWRTYLATSIALRNKSLSVDELNYAVQKTIDRIIFLRMCEDRGVEAYGLLRKAAEKGEVYHNLFALFHTADEKYNSGLFDFKEDRITRELLIDNKVLKTIIGELYYPKCEYEFSVMPADILGSVYERFLGKTITLTAGHHARVEEKPEVRKAGGVYYTPKYIVDYIVENTVGKLLEGKDPKDVEKLRICDPACGSGSFLIGAYRYLLDWHLKYYTEQSPPLRVERGPGGEAKRRRGEKSKVLTPDGNLTTAEKKKILLNNIYGVDIDPQAVEVTKLNLLLKALEGETQASINQQMQLFHERVLPNLSHNIQCGNSLIGPDFFDKQFDLFPDQMKKINAFDWKRAFPEVFKEGGFDAVIGNPPYVFGRDWKSLGIGDDQKIYLGSRYKSSPYQLDMFSIFMEKVMELSRMEGYVSLIVPNVWLTNTYSISTRAHTISNSSELIITVPPKNVFYGITVDTIIYSLKKSQIFGKEIIIKKIDDNKSVEILTKYDSILFLDGKEPISTSLTYELSKILSHIRTNTVQLGDIALITRGIHSYRLGGYGQTAFGSGPQTEIDLQKRPYHSNNIEEGYRPFIYGKDLKRFELPISREYVRYGNWLAEPRNPMFFEGERIYSRKILSDRLIVTIEKTNSVADQQVYITKLKADTLPIEYIAAVLGSKMMAFYIRDYFDEINDNFPQIKVSQLRSLPILIPPTESIEMKTICESIHTIINLHGMLRETNVPTQRQQLQRAIDHAERRIDELVYELYGLTEEEVAIVEGKSLSIEH